MKDAFYEHFCRLTLPPTEMISMFRCSFYTARLDILLHPDLKIFHFYMSNTIKFECNVTIAVRL